MCGIVGRSSGEMAIAIRKERRFLPIPEGWGLRAEYAMNESIDELFPDTSAEVKSLLQQVRSMVQAAIPEATEILYHGALGYGPTTSGFDRIMYIQPQNDYVNLGFFFGSDLSDPSQLVEGSGKRMRHVKIRSTSEAHRPELPPLVQDGWSKGVPAVANLHQARIKSPRPPVQS
jgi:hypothetical protein